jgi:hypothetical protein
MLFQREPRTILSNPPTLGSSHTSSLILIMALLLHLHESLTMIMPTMTHQPGAITSVGIDLHVGQNPKLGGEVCRQLTHLYIIFCRDFVYPCFAFFLFLCCSYFISVFENTKRPKNISIISLCLLL